MLQSIFHTPNFSSREHKAKQHWWSNLEGDSDRVTHFLTRCKNRNYENIHHNKEVVELMKDYIYNRVRTYNEFE